MVGFLIAVLSGALMSVQGVFNTQVTKASGNAHNHTGNQGSPTSSPNEAM